MIVESLLREVCQGCLRAGEHLGTQSLAERFGVSHTPIREALIALAAIGVIDLLPNRGAVVRQVTRRDVLEICQVRRALECEAVRSACGRVPQGELEAVACELRRQMEMRPPYQGRFVEQARQTDSRLHDLLASHCGNLFLANELGRLKILFRAFRDMAWEYDGNVNAYHRLGEESREHLAIVEALLADDRKGAARHMSRHILSGGKYWGQMLPERLRTNPGRRNEPVPPPRPMVRGAKSKLIPVKDATS